MATEVLSPVGRIVWGHPARSQTKKDQQTKQPVLRDGKPVEQWVFGLAIPKAEFEQHVWPYMQQEAATIFPQGTPQKFSWKIKDGDDVDPKGQPYANREGYAGHYVLTISTEAFAPPIFKFENGQYRQMNAEEIKTGDYVVVKLNLKANQPQNPAHTPGIYVNPVGIEHVGYGQEIVGQGQDPEEMFGRQTYQLPPGASATPVAPATGVAAPYGTSQTAPGAAPMQPANPAPMPAAQPAPAMPVPAATPATPGAVPLPNAPVANPTPAATSPVPGNPAPGQPLPAPAHDFVHNATGQQAMPAPQQPQPIAGTQNVAMPGIPTGR